MGGIGQFALSQMTPDQIAALQQQTAPAQPQPAMAGYSSDIASPAAMPINSPNAPGSTADLENRAAQAPQQLGQQLQQQQQPQQQPGAWSDSNPYGKLAQSYQGQLQELNSPENRGGRIKQLLTGFLGGMGSSMMSNAGLETPTMQRQRLFQNATTMSQLANNWESIRAQQKHLEALTEQTQQNTAFNAQRQPIELQAGQLGLQQQQQAIAAGQQAIPTVQPTMSAEDLTALGVPSDLATQYQGKPLTASDMGSLRQMAVAGQKQLFDYGQDGQGPNHGIWLMSKNYEPIKQIATVSETGRSVVAAKIQAQAQNNLIKSAGTPVYAYDPTSKQTLLTTMGDARNGGMQAIRGVKETDIRNDMHDTRVLNDVTTKANNVMDSASAMDSWNPLLKQAVGNILSSAQKDSNLELAILGVRIPTGSANAVMNSEAWHALEQNPQAKNYVISVLSLREAAMGLQRVLTGTARANESQINALQATIPGLEISGDLVRQKLSAFTQNVDMLRQGIPRIPGIDVVPVRPWNGKQAGQVSAPEPNPTSSTGRSNLQLF
jgi:hypothetical protein